MVYDEHLLWVRLERESYWYRIRMAVKFPERFLSIIIDGELNFQNFKINIYSCYFYDIV